jgi:hypothetical protein
VTSRERYRQLAAECLALAQQSQNPEHTARLLEMAEAWRELAERSARAESSADETGHKK